MEARHDWHRIFPRVELYFGVGSAIFRQVRTQMVLCRWAFSRFGFVLNDISLFKLRPDDSHHNTLGLHGIVCADYWLDLLDGALS